VSHFGKIRLWLSRLGGCNVVAIFCDSFTSFLSPVKPHQQKTKPGRVATDLIKQVVNESGQPDGLICWIMS